MHTLLHFFFFYCLFHLIFKQNKLLWQFNVDKHLQALHFFSPFFLQFSGIKEIRYGIFFKENYTLTQLYRQKAAGFELNIISFSLFPEGCNLQFLHSSQTKIEVKSLKNVAFSNGSDEVKVNPYSTLRIILFTLHLIFKIVILY